MGALRAHVVFNAMTCRSNDLDGFGKIIHLMMWLWGSGDILSCSTRHYHQHQYQQQHHPQIYQAVAPDAAVDGEKVKLQEALAEAEVPWRGVMGKPWV